MDKIEIYIEKIKEHKLTSIITSVQFLVTFVILATIIIASLKYQASLTSRGRPPAIYMIYKQSFLDLIAIKNIYVSTYGDYLYSPTFPFIIIPFAILPNFIGALLWDIVSALALLFATRLLPLSDWKKFLVFAVIVLEAVVALQNFQVNALAAALMIFTYAAFEKDKTFLAALLVAVGFFIKLYGLGFAVLFLFYPHKKKFLIYLASLCVILFLLPLLVMKFDFNHLVFLYHKWYAMLDHTEDT